MMRISLVTALILAFALPATAQDLIKLKDGRFHVCNAENDPPTVEDHKASFLTVLEENYDKLLFSVKLKGRSQRQDHNMAAVERIYYYPQPQNWLEATEAFNGGDYATAIQKFTDLAKNRSARSWLRVYSLYNIAQAYEAMSRWQQSIVAWEALANDFPKSRFVVDGWVRIGLAKLDLGDVAGAKIAFGKLARLPGLPEGKKLLAKYYLIYIKQKEGEKSRNQALISQAESEYRQLLTKVEDNPELEEVATLCRLGIGTCMVALEKFDEALKYFESIADSSKDPMVLAGAFNGMGQCYFRQERWKDALWAFLRVEILYDVKPAETAMAVFYSGRCFQSMQHMGIGEDNAIRARAQYRKCIQRFGGSYWGQQAANTLPTVRSDPR